MADNPATSATRILIGKPGETLGEAVYRTLLDLIFYKDFASTRLRPNEIAERFGVSSTPVREALSRLAVEGYIELIPRRGYHLRAPLRDHVFDTWQVRLGLELTGGEIAIARLKSGDLSMREVDDLSKLQVKIFADRRANAHRKHQELNSEFHRRIVAMSGNRMLIALYDSVQLHVLRAWIQRGSEGWLDRLDNEAAEHAAIVASMASCDFVAFSAALRKHLARSLTDALVEINDASADSTREFRAR